MVQNTGGTLWNSSAGILRPASGEIAKVAQLDLLLAVANPALDRIASYRRTPRVYGRLRDRVTNPAKTRSSVRTFGV
jgi:hypothetical protein